MTNNAVQTDQIALARIALERVCTATRVSFDAKTIDRYQTATFTTINSVIGVAYPLSTAEVLQIFEVAKDLSLVVYPVSGGKNWGLGSAAPTDDRSLIIDLSRMNRILEFNEELSYITVEPGVTFGQVSEFLREKGSDLFFAMIGGPSKASLIGNAVERGDGVGPHGDRATQIAALEVALPRGELLQTGFGAYGEFLVNSLTPHAPGPDIQGLFLQSNFGIVTKMTFWLRKKPKVFHGMIFTLNVNQSLGEVLSSLRELQGQGIIMPNSFALWSVWKALASQGQYPWAATSNKVLSESELRRFIPRIWRDVEWCGYIALYSASKSHARATERILKQQLKGKVSSAIPLNRTTNFLARFFKRPIKWALGIDPDSMMNSFYRQPVALGNPMDMNVKSLYWRKRSAPAGEMEPHKDRCGLHWVCHSVPFRAEDIIRVDKIIDEACLKNGFEPNLAFLNTSERILRLFAVLTYDRDVPGEDNRADRWLREVLSSLTQSGYPPFRLGVQMMDGFQPTSPVFCNFLSNIRKFADPFGILAPKRYANFENTLG